MSIETYEREIALAEVYKKMLIAENQIASNEIIDAEIVFKKLRAKYGSKVQD